MDTAELNSTIDTRMAQLTAEYLNFDDEDVEPCLRGTVDALKDQALIMNAGGKRLRARLLLDSYRAAATTNDAQATALDLACAVEIYQTSALVHDDIMDDSPLRRGKPSAHMSLSNFTNDAQSGKALALMLGNMLATLSANVAFRALHRVGLEKFQPVFLNMQRAVEIGQCLDQAAQRLDLEDSARIRQAALNVYAWKTASYTTVAPLELGFLCAGMPYVQARPAARAIGLPLGVAFQLRDDAIDVFGNPEDTGKPVGGDILEGKRTVLLADMLDDLNDDGKNTVKCIYASERRSDADIALMLGLLDSTDAIGQSKRRIDLLTSQSLNALERYEFDGYACESLVATCREFVGFKSQHR